MISLKADVDSLSLLRDPTSNTALGTQVEAPNALRGLSEYDICRLCALAPEKADHLLYGSDVKRTGEKFFVGFSPRISSHNFLLVPRLLGLIN